MCICQFICAFYLNYFHDRKEIYKVILQEYYKKYNIS